jgi:hypothetical protein
MNRILLFITLFLTISANTFSQNLTQTIKGVVVDKQSLSPLPGATIALEDTDPIIGTITGDDGSFRLENVPVGRYHVVIKFIGYQSLTLPDILVSTGKEVVLDIKLNESIEQVDEVVVSAKSIKNETINSMSMISARTFSVDETQRYAGSLDDPARMVSAFAGVTVGNIQDNAIIIRGNAPKNVSWRLEGVDIPNPNHFAGGNVAGGGFVTVFSSQMLSNSDFFSSAFPADYGNAISGVFDMRFRNGNAEKREHTFQVGLLGMDIASEGPFKKGSKATYLFNYRYSTMALIKPILPTQQVPEYQDLSFKFNFPTRIGTFSLWGIGAKDKNAEPEDDNPENWKEEWDRLKYDWTLDMGAVGLNYRKTIGNSTYFNTAIVASGTNNKYDSKRFDDNIVLQDQDFLNDINSKLTVSSYINHKFGPKHTNRTGIIYNHLRYDLEFKTSIDNVPPMTTLVDERGSTNLIQAYTQSKYYITENLSFSVGAHSQYFQLSEKFTFEPRAGLKWNFAPNHSISAGYGNHSSLEPLRIYFYRKQNDGVNEYPNKKLGLTRAHHYVLGYDWIINEHLRIKVEPYYQQLYDVPVIQDSTYSMLNFEQDWLFKNELVNTGTGVNYGVDFTLERFLKNNFYYLFTASVFDSKYKGGDGVEHSTRYNKGFVFNVLAGKEFYVGRSKTNILGINARFSVTGGQKTTPVDVALTEAAQDIKYDWNRPFTEQNPTDYYLDVTLSYRKNKPKYSSVWSIQVKNLLGAESNFYHRYNLQTQNIEFKGESIVVPNISYKIEF